MSKALVVLLKGVNVGGHRTFRPSLLAQQLKPFDVVNIGAAGTFVVRQPGTETQLRAAIAKRLPFTTEVLICAARDVLRLVASAPFEGERLDRDTVPFVSLLAKRRPPLQPLPYDLPAAGPWGLRILTQQNRFVVGVYRREMKAVSYLGQLEKIFGVPVTTRNWNTMSAIARVLEQS